MERVKVDFELPESLEAKRSDLIRRLLADPQILAWLKREGCSHELVERYPQRFELWLAEQKRIETLTLADMLAEPSKASYTDLEFYQGLLVDVVCTHPLWLQHQQKYSYLNAYQINDLPVNLHDVSFELIDEDQENLSSATLMNRLFNYTHRLENKGLFIYGKTGVGKTYLLACLSNALAKQGKQIAFLNVPEMLGKIKQSFGQGRQTETLIESIYGVEVLFLDDIGAELVTSYNRDEVLYGLLNYRLEHHLLTFFTSNFDRDSLQAQYEVDNYGRKDTVHAARIVSRLLALASFIELQGNDRRIL